MSKRNRAPRNVQATSLAATSGKDNKPAQATGANTQQQAEPATPGAGNAAAEPKQEQANEKAKASTVTIAGKGNVPLHVDGELVRLDRGKPITVTDAQRAALQRNGIEFK